MKSGIYSRIILLNTLILAVVIFFAGCAKTPVPEDTLVKVYADLVIAREKATNPAVDKKEIDAAVFKKYNIKRKDYEESIKILNKDPKQWEAFFDKVIEYLQILKKQNK
jgi:hypothetical protein